MNDRRSSPGGLFHARGLVPPLLVLAALAQAQAAVHGTVRDLNGAPVAQAMVTLTKAAGAAGPTATSVFTDGQGRYAFAGDAPAGTLHVRHLDFRQVDADPPARDGAVDLLVRPEGNQAGVAPASAWLRGLADAHKRESLVLTCVGCHQIPAPEVRDVAKLLEDSPRTRAPAAREAAWAAVVKQMNYVSDVEFGRAGGHVPSGENVYSGGDPGPVAKLLNEALAGPMQDLRGYAWGAPLIVTPRTRIREYEIPAPNAVREAVPWGGLDFLYAADVSANRLVRIDTRSGATQDFVIPGKELWGPHTLVPAPDGVWVTSFFPNALMRFDPRASQWKLWRLNRPGGPPVGVHDISFDANHELVTDARGRIWFSDIVNNALGYVDPKTGRTGQFPIPPVPGRVGGEQVYGLAMSPDRRHVWYCQVGIGSFGSFDVEKERFDARVDFDSPTAGPRRMSMSDDGVLYLALYGSGQLAAYDTKAGRMIGIYDLPDRAAAPYATTWDPLRRVVWIPTSNGDVIYRFDPRTRAFGVLPLPRDRTFLRMLHVDRGSGALVTSYGNIVEHVRGPRMALVIDPGDDIADRGRKTIQPLGPGAEVR